MVTDGNQLSGAAKLEDRAFEMWVCTVGEKVKGHFITVCNHQMEGCREDGARYFLDMQ